MLFSGLEVLNLLRSSSPEMLRTLSIQSYKCMQFSRLNFSYVVGKLLVNILQLCSVSPTLELNRVVHV